VVRIEVVDEGNAFSAPYVRDEPCAESGRGLRIVSTLAKRSDVGTNRYVTDVLRTLGCAAERWLDRRSGAG